MWWPFKRKQQTLETRASSTGYTAAVMSSRAGYLTGTAGVGELTGTVQSCVSLWEHALSLADVQGTTMLSRRTMGIIARSLALRGEVLLIIRGARLVFCADWDVATKDGIPVAYRASISDAGGNHSEYLLAGEVIHVCIGADAVQPWAGVAPLKRAALTAGLLAEVESVINEVYQNAPIASQIIPFPESTASDMEQLGAGFAAKRGRVMIRESTTVTAAGGAAPQADWKPQHTTPDITGVLPAQLLSDNRNAIMSVFGVLPSLLNSNAQGPLVREAQRHLAGWVLQPISALIAEEVSSKLGAEITIDSLRPVQAYDVGGRARALNTVVEALARAKETGITGAELNDAMTLVNWGDGDRAA